MRFGAGCGFDGVAIVLTYRFLAELDALVGPELVIFGGGLSKDADRFLKRA
jgi:hypothetical protein